jgi:glycosyltransferase involved in cell wall biosynthesis
MHVLITADTVGGVWTYTQELVTGLVARGIRVTLISLGAIPAAAETGWMDSLPGLDYRPTAFRLEWMQNSEEDLEESARYIESIVREVQPDLLHFNQYCYGSLRVALPRIVVAHSDVVSWWVAVHGHEPEESPWIRRYRETALRGMRGADVVVAPSDWMLAAIRKHYGMPGYSRVIYNGVEPAQFNAAKSKENCVLAVGRLWDPAKGISKLLEQEHPVPLWIAGPEEEPGAGTTPKLASRRNVVFLGHQRRSRLRSLFARAGAYAAPSVYEPFGLAPLEAALSGCALIVSDIPSFEEVWRDAPIYFASKSSDDLARAIRLVTADSRIRTQAAERAYERAHGRFTAEKMVDQYEHLYKLVAAGVKV